MEISASKTLPSWGAPTLEGLDTDNIQVGQRIGGKSNRQFVRFYKKQVTEPRATKARFNEVTGRMEVKDTAVVTVEKEFVEVVTPGDKNTVDDVAQDYHKREFWQHYKAFRDGKTSPIGNPIDNCQYVPSGIATELLYLGVHTEEQLADASDHLCDRIPNGMELREFARAVCQANKTGQSVERVNALSAELSKSQALIAEQAKAMDELRAQMKFLVNARGEPITSQASLETEPKLEVVKKGRPSKIETTLVSE